MWLGGMLGGGILMLVFWVVGIAFFVLFIKWIVGQGGREGKQDGTPLDILKQRYAKGELDKDQFEKMKKDLQ